MSPLRLRANRTESLACSKTCSRVMRSFFSMCRSLVARKMWIRVDSPPFNASAARVMSRSFARASEHTVEPLIAWAIAFTASKSPFDDAAKPASMTSTLSRSSWRAMRSFSSLVIEAPGDCSPSRRVVSKMNRRSVTAIPSQKTKRPAAFASGPVDETFGRGRSASPERSKKKQEGRTDSRHHRINIAQRGSVVQALLVGFVSGCCNHAHGLAIHLLPDIDAVAGDAIGDEQAEQGARHVDV